MIQELHHNLPDGAQIVALLHDEIVLECNEKDAEKVLKLTVSTMEEIASIIFSRVRMKAEGSIRNTWG